MLPTEADGHWQRDRTRRYFGAPALRAERSTRLKRWRRALQGAGERAAAAELGLGPGDGCSAALGLLALRKLPSQQQPAVERQAGRALDLPSLSYLPLRLEDEAGPAGPQQQQQAAAGAWPASVSAAAELAAEQAAAAAAGESLEEQLLRRTREFNRATRERPHDVQLWLRFARFQVRHSGAGY